MLWSVMPTPRRMIRFPPIPKAAACVLGLLAVLLTLEGCFFFRSKPDPKAQEITSRLSPGLTTYEVLELVGRNGQETMVDSEVQLLFERGKLVNWNVVPIKN